MWNTSLVPIQWAKRHDATKMPQLLCVKLEDPKNCTSQALKRSRAVIHLDKLTSHGSTEVERMRARGLEAYFVFQLQAVVIFTQYKDFFPVSLISLCLKIFRVVSRSKPILGGYNSCAHSAIGNLGLLN